MKFLIAFAAVAAVAVAVPVQRITPGVAGPTPIVDENGSPISIGPAILDLSPISVGPAIVNPTPVVEPSPVVIGDVPAGATPLVQIIVNVNGQEYAAVAPAPVVTPVEEPVVPGPVNIVDNVVIEPISPIQVVEPVVPGPVNIVDNVVVEPVIVEPVQVAEPVIVEPVQVAEPAIVEPVQVVAPTFPAPIVPVNIPAIIN